MKIFYIPSLLIVGISTGLHAQNISGSLLDANKQPLIGSSIGLLHAKDSSVVKYGFTDVDGKYEFESIPSGDYLLKIDDLNTGIFYSKSFTHAAEINKTLEPIIAISKSEVLKDVVITYKRPIVELKSDRTVFNIDSTINAVGQNGLELMRKSPGVLVDKDENISLSGKNGVRLYIDGRPSPLTGTELSEYLKTIQSSSIDAIEIISNPSAKYDASGNAGIINIRLKKNQNHGVNGSVNLGYATQVYSKYNGGFNINYRNDKFNVYGNYNGNIGDSWNESNFYRSLLDTVYSDKNINKTASNGHNYKVGLDYFLNDKSTLGVMVNGNARHSDSKPYNKMEIINRGTNEIIKYLEANNTTVAQRNNITANVNYAYNDKKSGKSLNLDADYGRYDINTDQLQPNIYKDLDGKEIMNNTYSIQAPTTIDMYSVKGDYEQHLLKGRLGLGAKVNVVSTDNDFGFDNYIDNKWVNNPLKSNDFNYNENVQALYATYSKQYNGIAMQLGLRGENTITKGRSIGKRTNDIGEIVHYDTTFDNSYFNIFPSVGVTFNKNPMNQFSINVARRIDRPNYQDLNPFELQQNDYSYRKGNIFLKPQITNSISVSHNYKYMINTKLEYSHVGDVFAELVDTLGYKLYQTKQNLATQDMISLNVSVPFQYGRFSSFFNLNTYYTKYRADYGEGRKIDLDAFSANIYGQLTYKINDWLTSEVSGWWTSPGIWQGTFKSIAMGGVDVGLQARVFKGKATFKVSYGDIFGTMKWGGSSNFAGQYVNAYGYWESRQLKLNASYNFGNNKVKSRVRKTAQDEERSRTSDGGGMMGGN